jgi:hypothetical protein
LSCCRIGLKNRCGFLFLPNQEVLQRCSQEVMMGVESVIAGKLGRLGLPQQVLAGLLDVSETYLSRGLKGVKPLGGPELLRIDEVLNNLIDISEIIRPFELPRTNVTLLRLLLARYEENGLSALRNLDALAELRAEIRGLQRV